MSLTKPGRKKPHANFVRRLFSVAETGRRRRFLIASLTFLGVSALVTQRLVPYKETFSRDIDSERIAHETVMADFRFQSVDLQTAKEAKDRAAASVPEQYRVDRERVDSQIPLLQHRIGVLQSQQEAVDKAIRKALLESRSNQETVDVVAKALNEFAAQLAKQTDFQGVTDSSALALWLAPKPACVPARVFEKSSRSDSAAPVRARSLKEPEVTPLEFANLEALSTLARGGLEYVLSSGVLGQGVRAGALGDKDERKIRITRENPVGDLKYTEDIPLVKARVVSDARDLLRTWIAEAGKSQLAALTSDEAEKAKLQNAAYELGKLDVIDTLSFDPVATESAREEARRAVEPQQKTIDRGQVIQRMGDPWTEQSRNDTKTYWALKETGQEPVSGILAALAGNMIFVALSLGCLMKGMPLLSPDKEDSGRNTNLALLLLLGILTFGRISSYIEPTGYIVPVTTCAILLAILVGARVAVMTSLVAAILVSIQYGYDWRLLVTGTAMPIAAVFSIFRVRRRSDMTGASVKATAVGILIVLAIALTVDSLANRATGQRIVLIVLNGVLCLFFVPGLLSPLEKLFKITTDIQLLEYSDLNNEVLSRLAIEVPATYAHSLMLGQLAEAAADAVGANGLLARVSAYYHDIGKLRRPEYFSENQTGVNVHDTLPPRLSSRAIAAHVTEGAEMAREYHLPEPIIDGILEHHGTGLISFFYQQAQAAQKHGDVREDDFRYPGPKPQSRETAILMICDAVESGVRSIKNPNEERIREFVDKIIAARSADRQFDECGLTLKDLDTIGEVITKRMLTSLHTRIAYPEKTPEKKLTNVVSLSGGQE
ncbi:MAG: HDIG domain-containing protein [Candidatus Hydrogenedentes bacterium]|nr:HDIG domain-containing protein [Candidatus Hydrogenedentota bacterium]